jgi:hypothetical protein
MDVNATACVDLFEGNSIFWGIGTEWEKDPLSLNLILSFQTVNTHGTEIAPGSDII